MHPAIELLMKRMESNPDEFVRGNNKDRMWGSLIERYKEYMTKEDRDALRVKYGEIQMGQLHKEVMAELLREPREQMDLFASVSASNSFSVLSNGGSDVTTGFVWEHLEKYGRAKQEIKQALAEHEQKFGKFTQKEEIL